VSISNKAPFWMLFAAGGTLTAFMLPAVVALFLLNSLGMVPDGLDWSVARQAVVTWPGRLIGFVMVCLSAWHAAHRVRVFAHDLGLRADLVVATVAYALAAIATVLAGALLLTAT
jgi:fumarate reductase subunit D